MTEKKPWERAMDEVLPPPRHGDIPPHQLLAEGQKEIWTKLEAIEALLQKAVKQ